MKMMLVVLSVLFVSVAHAGTVTCTTVGNVTTCVEQPDMPNVCDNKYMC
jgi:hypothetical protein